MALIGSALVTNGFYFFAAIAVFGLLLFIEAVVQDEVRKLK